MQEFSIELHSFQKVKDFVALATVQPFSVLVGNGTRRVNGKSFMGMFTLDYTQPLSVRVNCDGEEFSQFAQAAARLAAE